MKVSVYNMTSPNGTTVANQFVINIKNEGITTEVFQSYNTVIAQRENGLLTLDSNALEYSNTTLKYLKIFLNKTSYSKKALYKWIEENNINVIDLN